MGGKNKDANGMITGGWHMPGTPDPDAGLNAAPVAAAAAPEAAPIPAPEPEAPAPPPPDPAPEPTPGDNISPISPGRAITGSLSTTPDTQPIGNTLAQSITAPTMWTDQLKTQTPGSTGSGTITGQV